MSNSYRILKAIMWYVALYHIFVGLSVNLSMTFTQLVADGYGATVDWTPQFIYILKPLGAFMIVLGLFAAVAARDPLRHPEIVTGFCILFIIRALHRLIWFNDIERAFNVSFGRSMGAAAVMIAHAIVLYLVLRAVRRESAT